MLNSNLTLIDSELIVPSVIDCPYKDSFNYLIEIWQSFFWLANKAFTYFAIMSLLLLLVEKINWNYVGLVIYYKLGVNTTASIHYNVLS